MFEAMYYPNASIKNEETLKRCLFYLDKIYVLTPEESTISQNRSDLENFRRSYWKSNSIYKQVDKETTKKIIEQIHPSETFDKYHREFVKSVEEDLIDEKFRELSGQEDSWMLYEQKMPLLRGIGFKDKIRETRRGFIKVDRDFGESILINHVIFACLNKKISPLTDEIEHSRVLTYKMKRNYETYKDFLYEEGYIEDLKHQLLIKRVIEKRLDGLENVDIKDIICYREDHKKELKKFSVEMGNISTQIKSNPFDPDFECEVSQTVKDRIDPSIEALNESMQEFKDEMVKKYASKIIPVVTTFSISAVNSGLEIGVLSSLLVNLIQSQLHNDGTELIGTILDHWQQNRRYERNSLQYLISAEKKFNI